MFQGRDDQTKKKQKVLENGIISSSQDHHRSTLESASWQDQQVLYAKKQLTSAAAFQATPGLRRALPELPLTKASPESWKLPRAAGRDRKAMNRKINICISL